MVKLIRSQKLFGGLLVFLLLAAGVALVLAGGCTPVTPTPGLSKVIVADAPTTHHLNLYVAQEKGLFKKHGVEVEIRKVEDLASARDIVVVGEADVFWSCPTIAIAAIAGGAPLQIIAQVKEPCTSVLAVPENSPIKEYKDLNGKLIAGISPACEAVIVISKAAKAAGAEFTLIKLAGGTAIAALEAGKVDGAVLEEPHASIAELKGYRIMFREAALAIPCRTINVRTGFLRENPDVLRRMIKAIDEANDIFNRDPVADEIIEIAYVATGAPKDAIRLGNPRLGFTIYINEKGYYGLGDDLVELGNIKENPREKMFAPEFRGITWGLEKRPVR